VDAGLKGQSEESHGTHTRGSHVLGSKVVSHIWRFSREEVDVGPQGQSEVSLGINMRELCQKKYMRE